jgi:rRNA-processing protein FCF1
VTGIQPLLIVDSTALLATQLRQWQEWAAFGRCVLPQVVWQEMDFLTRRAISPESEAVARAFLRFHESERRFEVSGARVLLEAGANVSPISPISQRARQSQAIAECAYALAKQHSQAVVMVLSHDRLLVERINRLGIPNLGSISVPQLTQWIRQDQVPPVVQTLLKRPKPPATSAPSGGAAVEIPAFVPKKSLPPTPPPPPLPPASLWHQIKIGIRTLMGISLILVSLGILSVAGLVAWRVYDPQGSEWLWETLRLPRIL